MRIFLLLVLIACSLASHAQEVSPAMYVDAHGRYQLTYLNSWQLRKNTESQPEATFVAGTGRRAAATVTLAMRSLPDAEKDLRLTVHGGQDSTWQRIQRLPGGLVLGLEQQDFGAYDEVRYDYTYAPAPAPAARLHVLGRQIWRAGYEFRVEYRAEVSQDSRYLAQGQQLIASFAFTAKPLPGRRYADQQCDDKLYGIAATHRVNGQLLDDCRTIHEFSSSDLTAPPVAHRRALPFQSYALAKGFDNCLYAVTKAPTNSPELVYRYNPATRQGSYTTWQLPAQGDEVSWISAATDDRGYLYFITSDSHTLVKISPYDNTVTTIWSTDPLQKTNFYPQISFAHAGTHGNFCLDDAHTLYQVYSTDGSLMKVDMTSRQPYPERMMLEGLPARGGYSDLLMQNDAAGRRRLYLAGPHGVYKVDLARHQATFVRRGTYTDLAGCNLFRISPHPTDSVPAPPTTAQWRGRVLNAATAQPLPTAQLRIGPAGAETLMSLSAEGTFSYLAEPDLTYTYHAQLTGFLATDSIWVAAPGSYVRDILLRPLAVGTTLPLDNVQFEQGTTSLLPASFPALDQLVSLMTTNSGMSIELRGHTDNVGPADKNLILSQQRVAAVKEYLVSHEIAEGRITGLGFGGTKPLASNAQEDTRKLNRRVEFRVTGMGQ